MGCDAINNSLIINNSIRELMEKITGQDGDGIELPLVSVVMTVYNREMFLKESIESVLNQTYQNIELIIVNDGSADSCESIIKSYDDKRITYVPIEHSGQLAALSAGLKRANGQFITRVDSDDIIDSKYIETCVNEMIQNPSLDFVYTDFVLIDGKGKSMEKIQFRDFKNWKDVINSVFMGFSSTIPDVAFWKKEYIENVMKNYVEQNIPFYIDSIKDTNFYHIKKGLYYYRKHDKNYAKDDENHKKVIEGKIKFMDFIIRRYFIQLDMNGNFKKMDRKGFKIIKDVYSNLSEIGQFKEGIKNMFKEEEEYWNSIYEKKNDITYRFKNPRILIVSTDDAFKKGVVGGKHTHIRLLYSELLNFNVSLYFETYNYYRKKSIDLNAVENDYGIKPSTIDSIRNKGFLCLVHSIEEQLKEKIEKRIKSSYVSCISCQDVIAAMAAKRALANLNMKIPVVTTLHGYFTFENRDYGGMEEEDEVYNFFLDYEKRACAASDFIIAVDTRIKQYVESLMKGITAPEIHVLKNAVDINEYHCAEETVPHEKLILVPRRLVPKNGVKYAVMALRELVIKGYRDFKLLIAGDGTERSIIEEYIRVNNLSENVELLGNVPHDNMPELYSRCSVVVIPSVPSNNVEEATSLSALEGMASGRVVIASNIGGLKEIIRNGCTGFLVNPKNVEELSNAMLKVLTMDAQTYGYMASKAQKEAAANYGSREHAEKYLEHFNSCAANILEL